MKVTKLFIVTVMGLIITAGAQADVTVIDNQTDYDTAVGPELFLIDFNPSPESPAYVGGDTFSSAVIFGSPEASDPSKVLHSSNAITDAGSTIAPNGVGPVAGLFSNPVYAFALVFTSATHAETVYLYDASYTFIDSVTAPNPSGFFGVTSDTPIKIFAIYNGEFPSGDPDRFFVDDFRANGPSASVIKTVEGADEGVEASLGDHLTVTLVVDNPYSEDIVVEDVLPDGLAYIGNFIGSTPEVEGNVVATMVGPGETTINFDVQVVEVQYEDVIVTNTAYVYDPDDGLDASDSVDITLHPYAGFFKDIVAWLGSDDPYNVPVETDVYWVIMIAVGDIDDDIESMQDIVIKDNLAGDLELNDVYGEGVTVKEKGKTNKIQLTWAAGNLDGGNAAAIGLLISTDVNPGQGNKAESKNEYTSDGEHELNSGAVLKFSDPDTGLQLSAHTPPIVVNAYVPED